MIETTLKVLAIAALASIAVNTVKWLFRHPASLILIASILYIIVWLTR